MEVVVMNICTNTFKKCNIEIRFRDVNQGCVNVLFSSLNAVLVSSLNQRTYHLIPFLSDSDPIWFIC